MKGREEEREKRGGRGGEGKKREHIREVDIYIAHKPPSL